MVFKAHWCMPLVIGSFYRCRPSFTLVSFPLSVKPNPANSNHFVAHSPSVIHSVETLLVLVSVAAVVGIPTATHLQRTNIGSLAVFSSLSFTLPLLFLKRIFMRTTRCSEWQCVRVHINKHINEYISNGRACRFSSVGDRR